MKDILLLGANGFVGRNLNEYFHSRCSDLRITAPSSKELNLLDEGCVKNFLKTKKFDVVINAAIGNPCRGSFETTRTELEQDLRMFFHLEKYHDLYGRMLYFGSGAEFNKSEKIESVCETNFSNNLPQNEYGFAKYVIGRAIESSTNIYNLRIFGLFGKYENWRTTFISGACCKAIKGLPITIRQNVFFDYLYIEDFLPVIKWFLENDPQYHSYNIVSGRRIDLVTIAEIVKNLSGSTVPIYVCKSGLANEYTASNQRLVNECRDFKLTDFEISIQHLLDYYRSVEESIDLFSLLYQ